MRERIESARTSIIEALERWLPEGMPIHIAVALLVTIVATLGLLIFWRAVRYLFGLFTMKIASLEGTQLRPVRFQNEILLSTKDLINFAARFMHWVGTAVILIGFYVYVQIVLGQFPATEDLAEHLVGYGAGAIKLVAWSIIAYVPNLFIIFAILFVARGAVSLARLFFDGITRRRIRLAGFYSDWGEPTYQLARVGIYLFAAVMIFPYLPGHGSSAFQAIGIFFGVLVSLGSSAAVANMISGVVLTYMRPFRIGDRVQIADAVGDVVEKTTFITRIRTPKNVDITIANSTVMNNNIINYSARAAKEGLALHVPLTIGYDVPWETVHDLLLTAAGATEGVVQKPEAFVLQTALDDFYVAYELNAYTNDAREMIRTYSELRRNILDRFHEAGVEIMSPHFGSLRDGSATSLPPTIGRGQSRPGREE